MSATTALVWGLVQSTAAVAAVAYGTGTLVAPAPSVAPTPRAVTTTAAPTSAAPATTTPVVPVVVEPAVVPQATVVPQAVVTSPPPTRTGGGVIHAPADHASVTLADLTAVFGSKVSTSPRVAEGLPSLNRAMKSAGITTPQRKAAFLATLAYESTFDYALEQAGYNATYRGRGYIQLSNDFNYRAAGNYLGVNLISNPRLASSLEWSAPIAIWYWTVQRPHSNAAADNFDMGLISRYIGYGASGTQDQLRCDAFKRAYQHFSGSPAPSSTVCYRH